MLKRKSSGSSSRWTCLRVNVAAALAAVVSLSSWGLAPEAMARSPLPGQLATVGLSGGAVGVAVQGRVLAAIRSTPAGISIIDTASLQVRSTTPLPVVPSAVVLTSDGTRAYVLGDTSIFVIDTDTGALLKQASYDDVPGATFTGVGPGMMSSLAISPDGRRLNVTINEDNENAAEVWAIDPDSLNVVDKVSMLRGFSEGVGVPRSRLVSFDKQTFAVALKTIFKCQESGPCAYNQLVAVEGAEAMKAALALEPPNFYQKYVSSPAIARDPFDDTLLAASGAGLMRIDAASRAVLGETRPLGQFAFSTLDVDPIARRAYANIRRAYANSEDGKQGTVVVDLLSNSVLGGFARGSTAGRYTTAFFDSRGYFASKDGVTVIEPARMLGPVVEKVSLKLRPAGKGRVRVTATWPPAIGPDVSIYRAQIYSTERDKRQKTYTCTTRKLKCEFVMKRVAGSGDGLWSYYSSWVTASSKDGVDGPSTYADAPASPDDDESDGPWTYAVEWPWHSPCAWCKK